MAILRFAHLKNLWGYMEMADEIIEELWKIKDGIAEEYGFDVKALVAHLRSRKRGEGQQTFDLRGMQLTAEQDPKADRQQKEGI
jgi:hypothetical protein